MRLKRLEFWLKLAGVCLTLVCVAAAGLVWWMLPGRYSVSNDVTLPTRYEGDRFYVEPVTSTGVKLNLLTDTGGGLMLSAAAVERCGLKTRKFFGLTLSRLPALQSNAWIPEPTGAGKWMRVSPPGDVDGMLGQRWFAGGVWTFDYPARQLVLRGRAFEPTAEMRQRAVNLGFHKAWLGFRDQNHPRILVTIAGEPVEALFDTGATVWLSPEAMKILNVTNEAERGTSFVTASLFARWRQTHPDWRVIERGCTKSGEALIEVPEVRVAGFAAGPVWFTRRQDGNYVYMSRFMDRPVVAAIGGNFLKHFRVTLDYPHATAYFELTTQ